MRCTPNKFHDILSVTWLTLLNICIRGQRARRLPFAYARDKPNRQRSASKEEKSVEAEVPFESQESGRASPSASESRSRRYSHCALQQCDDLSLYTQSPRIPRPQHTNHASKKCTCRSSKKRIRDRNPQRPKVCLSRDLNGVGVEVLAL